jgi:hypothetical protein
LTTYVHAAGIQIDNDAEIGSRHPADLLNTRLAGELSLVVDVVVTHPLAPSLGLSAAAAAAAVRTKATRKTTKYAALNATHSFEFAPLAFSTFGEQGDECSEFTSQAVAFYCAKNDLSRSEAEAQFQQQLSVALMRQVGQRLLAAVPCT